MIFFNTLSIPYQALSIAVEFLQNALSEGKEVPASSIFAQARALGVSKRTMENVKQELGVKSIKSGSLWMWKMP